MSFPAYVTEPPVADWLELIQANRARWRAVLPSRDAAQQALLAAARDYTLQLEQAAERAGIAMRSVTNGERLQATLGGACEVPPLIMTGHQPQLLHSGIATKYRLADGFVEQHAALGVAVVIDTDEGDPVEWLLPSAQSATVLDSASLSTAARKWPAGTERVSWCTRSPTDATLYAFAQLKDAAIMCDEAARWAQTLAEYGLPQAGAQLRWAAAGYAQLMGTPALEATVILRRAAGCGAQLLELPLSRIAALDATRHWIAAQLADPVDFLNTYNRTLEAYRQAHHIDNPANPFPNLQRQGSACEVPLWLVDRRLRRRTPLWLQRVDQQYEWCDGQGNVIAVVPQGEWQDRPWPMTADRWVVPRHAMITLLLRTLYSDLFLHGTGGGKYDRFTDALIEQRWGPPAPQLAVATASRYLMDAHRTTLQHWREVAAHVRDWAYRAPEYLGRGVFRAATEQRLAALAAERAVAVDQLKQLKSRGESAREVDHALRRLSQEMRSIVESEFQGDLQSLSTVSASTERAVTSREYPWILFPDDPAPG